MLAYFPFWNSTINARRSFTRLKTERFGRATASPVSTRPFLRSESVLVKDSPVSEAGESFCVFKIICGPVSAFGWPSISPSCRSGEYFCRASTSCSRGKRMWRWPAPGIRSLNPSLPKYFQNRFKKLFNRRYMVTTTITSANV